MRKIKFRLWDKYSERMIAWDEIETPQEFHLSASFNKLDELYELMQFTGLTDKNGREICEGDILSAETTIGPDGPEHKWHDIGVVEWGEFHWRPFMSVLPARCEVIGNIYENQELLNAKP